MSGSAGSVGGSLPREPAFQIASTIFLASAVTPSVATKAVMFLAVLDIRSPRNRCWGLRNSVPDRLGENRGEGPRSAGGHQPVRRRVSRVDHLHPDRSRQVR